MATCCHIQSTTAAPSAARIFESSPPAGKKGLSGGEIGRRGLHAAPENACQLRAPGPVIIVAVVRSPPFQHDFLPRPSLWSQKLVVNRTGGHRAQEKGAFLRAPRRECLIWPAFFLPFGKER